MLEQSLGSGPLQRPLGQAHLERFQQVGVGRRLERDRVVHVGQRSELRGFSARSVVIRLQSVVDKLVEYHTESPDVGLHVDLGLGSSPVVVVAAAREGGVFVDVVVNQVVHLNSLGAEVTFGPSHVLTNGVASVTPFFE